MATGKKMTDKFANMATITVTESAANTLTYKKLETGMSLFEKYAWIINRIEYFFTFNATLFNASADTLALALTTTNTRSTIMTNATFTDPSVLDLLQITRTDIGAAASGFMITNPIVKDFSSLPGGGLIAPPAPMYGAAEGSSLVSATTSIIKLYYTILELNTEDYWELVEARRLLTA